MDKKLTYFTLPNLFTVLSLISGSLAIFFATDLVIHKLHIASYFVLIALVFDFLDGFIARLTNSESKLGKELDSLSDLVSFGVAPAVIIFQMLKMALEVKGISLELPFTKLLILASPILLIVAAALRLAKFNVDERQRSVFMGLATPASALFFISFAIIYTMDSSKSYEFLFVKLINDGSSWLKLDLAIIGMYVFIFPKIWLYLISIFTFTILQLLNVPMFSLKFDGFKLKDNLIKYIFIFISLILIILLQALSLPFIVIIYILFSFGDDLVRLFTKK